jgi:hypothetical protein
VNGASENEKTKLNSRISAEQHESRYPEDALSLQKEKEEAAGISGNSLYCSIF